MRRERLWLAVVLALLTAVTVARIRLIDSLPDQGYFAKYTVIADRILSGQLPRDRLADFSPGYLWFIVALRAIGLQFTAIRGFQIALVSVAALLAGLAARRFGTVAALAAAVLLLGSRGALICATELEPETLILLLNAAALAALEYKGGSKLPHSIGGLLLGLSAICRPSAILTVAVVAVLLRSWRVIAAAAVPIVLMLAINLALTGEAVLMDPGTVFYEGMNPSATGYEGVQPRIVNDLERSTREPDYLHVAYRVVASRSVGRALSRAESNRFWTGKALAFARSYPFAALRLVARKLFYALHSYEAYDLATMARKDQLIAPWLFVPFGIVVALAGVGVLFRRHDVAIPLAFAATAGIVMVAFYVTARQRNAMLPAMVVLAGTGFAEIAARRHWPAAVTAAIVAILLSVPGPVQIEDANGWRGVRNDFDAAIALEQEGRWADADALLARLEEEGYRPSRENRAVSSTAFYRARAAQHLGRDPRPFLLRAEQEAPGNEHVLALEASLGDAWARSRLFALHDVETARRALLATR